MADKETMQLREAWLEQAVKLLRDYMATCSIYLYSYPRASCGFPSRGGEGGVIGQCFSPKVSRDGRVQIFVSPVISGSIEVLGVLLHELIHAAVGVEHKHGKEFSQAAKKVGLVRPWRSTTVGETLRPELDRIMTLLGHYPHAAIQLGAIQLETSDVPIETSDVPKKSVGSRLRLYECSCHPPVKVRVASDHFQAQCLRCNKLFRLSSVNMYSLQPLQGR